MARKKRLFGPRPVGGSRFYPMRPLAALSRFNTLGGGSALANKVDAGVRSLLLPTLRPGSI